MAKITRIFAILELFECGPILIFLTVCVDTVCVDTNEGHERYNARFPNRKWLHIMIFYRVRNAFSLMKGAIFIKIAPTFSFFLFFQTNGRAWRPGRRCPGARGAFQQDHRKACVTEKQIQIAPTCSYPIWKSRNDRFPNSKWTPWAIYGSFPIWKSTNDRFPKRKLRGYKVRNRSWDMHAPGRPAGPAEDRA